VEDVIIGITIPRFTRGWVKYMHSFLHAQINGPTPQA